MPVTRLELHNIGPIADTAFEFDPRVNVLIGPNNSGKTTALLALAYLLVDGLRLPERLLTSQSWYKIEFDGGQAKAKFREGGLDDVEMRDAFGYRAYIPAMRLATNFHSEGPGQTRKQQGIKPAKVGQAEDIQEKALWSDDKLLVQQMVDLDYRAYRESRPNIRELLNLSAALASEITEGFPLEFAGIGEDKIGLFPRFKTPDGIVPMGFLSQGTQSLIQWSAQLVIGFARYHAFPESFEDKKGVLLIDEIDAHLHPSWQRRVLPALTKKFPALQIVCAAHSPMTIAGLHAGQIQLLRRNSEGGISVSRNAADIIGWSADEIYSTFLDVDPTDMITLERRNRAQQLRAIAKPTQAEINELNVLREEIRQGLSGGSVRQESEVLAAELNRAANKAAKEALQTNGRARKRAVAAKPAAPPARRRSH